MPVSQINKTITPYSGDPPAIGQDQQTFSANAFRKAMHDPVVVEDINQVIGQINAVASEMNAAITEAVTKANEADQSANDAEASKLHARDYANEAAQIKADTQTLKEQANQARLDAEAALDAFDDKYLGSKTSDPTLDNDGESLQEGAFYVNSTTGKIRVFTNGGWVQGIASVAGVESINAIQGAINLKSINGVSLLGEGDIQTATLDEEEALTNKTIVDPILALSGTNGLAGQVPVSQGESLPPVWENIDTLPAQSGNRGKFLTTDGSAASWVAVDSPYKTKRISLSANLTTSGGSFSTNANGSRHFAFGDLFLYENSSGGFVAINTSTDTLVQQVSFGFTPIYFAKVSETRLLVGRVFNQQTDTAYVTLTMYNVSPLGVDLVTPVATGNINTPYCVGSPELYALPVVVLTESKFLLGFINYRSGTAYLNLTPVVYTTTFTRGNISERYLGPTLSYVYLADAMRVDDNRAIIVTGYYAGGASDNTWVHIVESTDGVAITEGNTSPTSSYARAYQYTPFDQDSRPICKVNNLQFFVVTFNSSDNTTRRFSLLTLNPTGVTTTNSTLLISTVNLGSNGIVKVYKGATDSNLLVLSCASQNSPGADYFSISGTTLSHRSSATFGSSNDGSSQQFAILSDDRTKAYIFGAVGFAGFYSLFLVAASITSTSLSYQYVANNIASNNNGAIRSTRPVKLTNGLYAQITSLGAVQSDFSFKTEMRYKLLPIEGNYNSMNLVGSKSHIIGKGYIDIAEISL